MIIFDYKENVIKFMICAIILIVAMLVISKIFYQESSTLAYNEVSTSTIEYNDDTTSIYIEYPRFNENIKVNEIISNNIYQYTKEFKEDNRNKILDVSYKVHYIKDFVNVEFHIENSLSKIKNRNILINLKTNEIAYITSLYDEEYLKNEIYNKTLKDYGQEVYEKIKNGTINNFTYLIDDTKLEVYFNNIDYYSYEYIPFITINVVASVSYDESNNDKKVIAFTYDDGPSEYTEEILNVLEENNSSATFFMLGKKMKFNEELIKKIYNSSSEIGSHGYDHKDLLELNEDQILEELNSTNIIFNEITSDKITLFRPPYGNYNDSFTKYGYKIVLWNVNPKDWLFQDSSRIYNNVIKNACDGCIVVMHDTYEETLEATKLIIPELKKKNFEIVSVSKLLESSGIKYDNLIISNK